MIFFRAAGIGVIALISMGSVGCHGDKPQSPPAVHSNSTAQATIVAIPSRAGTVVGRTENSDAFIWELFTQFTAPVDKSKGTEVIFETWASDKDTFSDKPHWPQAGEPLELQPSFLSEMKTLGNEPLGTTHAEIQAALAKLKAQMRSLKPGAKRIDVNCEVPPGAAIGGFPTGACKH
jgi:hypothetical protein